MSDEMYEAMKTHGAISWHELMTTDVAGAKAFYGELLGWTLEDMDSGGMDYTVAKTGDTDRAGIMAIPEESKGMPPMWGAYITVDDVDESVQRVTALGGKVLQAPRDIPKVGRYATIADPQGAVINLMTYVDEACD